MQTLREQLALAEHDLRMCEEVLETREASLALEVQGKNAEERKANLVLAKRSSVEYQRQAHTVNQLRLEVAQLKARIEDQRERERRREWAIRAELVKVLGEIYGVAVDSKAFDTALDEVATQATVSTAQRSTGTGAFDVEDLSF